MTDTVHDVMAMARLVDAAAQLSWSRPGCLSGSFDAFLAALANASGKTRAELDGMSSRELHALMERLCMGDGYADALDVAREAWNGD